MKFEVLSMKYVGVVFLFFMLVLTACEEVIPIDLNEENPFVVIEADLQQGTNHFDVYIKQTKSYFQRGIQPPVNNATVEMTNASGEIQKAVAIEPGMYRFENYEAVTGEAYELNVEVNDVQYTAETTVPSIPVLDSLTVEFEEASLFQEEGYNVILNFVDPGNEPNFYRILYALNDTFQNKPDDLILVDDQLLNGNPINIPIFVNTFQSGDTVDVDLRNIDQATYNFYTTLSEIIIDMGGGNSAAPGNPISNIQGGAIGYFGSFSSAKARVVVE